MTGYDIVGDIHGQGDKLLSLLDNLGYQNIGGTYKHPEDRKIIFLGDFVDRGSNQKLVIDIARTMVESGNAYAVMGNHELNAIAFHTYNNETGEPNRTHSEKNIRQHKDFLKEFPIGSPETEEVINWFKTLPLFIELDNACFIHAYWNKHLIEDIKPYLNDNNSLTDDGFSEYFKNGSKVYNAVDKLLKGIELKLPEGLICYDGLGNSYNSSRYKWWDKNIKTFFDAATDRMSEEAKNYKIENYGDVPVIPSMPNKNIFFGHYWFKGEPALLEDNIVCLDYSACVGNNPLVAYRLNKTDMSQKLNTTRFVKSHTL